MVFKLALYGRLEPKTLKMALYSVKKFPEEEISLDIHFQDDLTTSNIATLTTELVISKPVESTSSYLTLSCIESGLCITSACFRIDQQFIPMLFIATNQASLF